MARTLMIFGLGLMLGAVAVWLPRAARTHAAMHSVHQGTGSMERTHTQRTFEFDVNLPLEQAAPLFGADRERVWAPGWSPTFLWPPEPRDRPGMVFTVAHAERNAIWIAPAFDLANGFVQYVYVIPDVMVTLISVRLVSRGNTTHAVVGYERTALTSAANDIVRDMAEHDGRSGPEWGQQIADYVSAQRKGGGLSK